MSELVDNEWLKFMSRISRHQNCDNADESSGGDDDEPVAEAASFGCSMGSSSANTTLPSSSSKSSSSIKKSCISKKAQRRTYSFLDPSIITNHDDGVDAELSSSQQQENGGGGGDGAGEMVAPDKRTVSFHPTISPIYISTKTKIAYLNKPVNIYETFWDVPVQHYYERKEGVVKKQIKFQTTDPAFITYIKEKLANQPRCYDEFVIEHIENPTGRIQYKDQRKVSIGICKKDIQSGNTKKKRAFFNCFVLILRINGGIAPPEDRAPEDDILYKEMHVKVFNTGKLEIPGIQEDSTLIQVLQLLVKVLRPLLGDDLNYLANRCETALINSNFNCGFYIDRDNLYQLLKFKYRMNCNYDSCSYPGIQSKFYYIPGKKPDDQIGQQPISMETTLYYEVSFMIFRTGSILIVGKCNEEILMTIYRFICSILTKEYAGIQMGDVPSMVGGGVGNPDGTSKGLKTIRKKRINITNIQYYNPESL